MSGFTKTFKDEIEFDGDTVFVEMNRLARKDMAKFSQFAKEGDDGEQKISFSDGIEMMEVAAEILPNYIVKFGGLKTADGEPLELEDILNESYFMELIGSIVGLLVQNSLPSKEEEKK